MAYVNQNGQVRIGVRGWVPVFTPEDPGTPNTIDQDSTNFIIAAGISDSVQTSAIETLVSDLKAYGLWTKMKAIYPFVGGSAASHKFNLKDPRDLNAAYRLVFNGGWVHSSNGAKPNGTTGYADTFFIPSTNLGAYSVHLSYYSKTNRTYRNSIAIGAWQDSPTHNNIDLRLNGNNAGGNGYSVSAMFDGWDGLDYASYATTRSDYFLIGSKTAINLNKVYENGALKGTNTTTSTRSIPNVRVLIGAEGRGTTGVTNYDNLESAFASIGDGLSDTDASNFYISVQKFQTTLGRHVGTPYVSDPDAIAFLMAAGITDGTQAAAINTLVIRMKADGVWTKMKAIYPFVGGSAASHKFNLKDPRDLDAAYRLVFYGGGIHSSTGYQLNGSNSWGDTKLIPSTILSPGNISLGFYSRTNRTGSNRVVMGTHVNPSSAFLIYPRFTDNTAIFQLADDSGVNRPMVTSTLGFYQGARNNSTTQSLSNINGNNYSYTYNTTSLPNTSMFVGSVNYFPSNYVDSLELSFSYIGENLSAVDMSNYYTAVQAFQTTLGRQVNVPLVSDTDAQAFLNAANITSFQQASAVNKLVVDLKAAGVWTKMKAIYPFVGGSAATHKFNLKDPRDLDDAFRLVFNGGWTHTSTGALPNGTTGWANTYYDPSTLLNPYIGYYSRSNTNTNLDQIDIGSSTYEKYLWVSAWYKTGPYNNILSRNSSMYVLLDGGVQTDSRGWYWTNKISNVAKLGRNSNILTTANDSITPPSKFKYIGALNYNTSTNFYSNRETGFSAIGDGLTDTDTTALYTAVQTYQTSLGRAVNTPVYNNGLVLNLDAGNANSYPGTGTTWFDLAAGNNGTLVNGPTYDVNNGGSLYFDGTNKYTDISYTKINITNKLTINAWVYFLSQPSTNSNPNIIDKWDWPNNKRAFSLGTENGYLSTSISYDGLFDNRIVCSDNSSIILNQWINITMTYDGRTLKLYKNGSLIQSSSFSQDRNIFSDITTNIFLGRSRGSEGISRHVNARISGVQIYSNLITPTEILNNFNSTRGRFGL